MRKFGVITDLPTEARIKYEEDLLILVEKVSFIIRKSLINDSTFKEQYTELLKVNNRVDTESNEPPENTYEYVIKAIEAKIILILNAFFKRITRAAVLTNKINYKSVEKSVNDLKKSIPALIDTNIQTEMRMWVSQNVRLIKTIPEKMLAQAEDIIFEAIRTGVSHKELSNRLIESLEIPKKRAVIIARDQINKLNGKLTRERNLKLGITEYKWITCNDERVRHSHEVLHNKICSWLNVRIYKDNVDDKKELQRTSINATLSNPSEDVLCRCSSIPIIKIFNKYGY